MPMAIPNTMPILKKTLFVTVRDIKQVFQLQNVIRWFRPSYGYMLFILRNASVPLPSCSQQIAIRLKPASGAAFSVRADLDQFALLNQQVDHG